MCSSVNWKTLLVFPTVPSISSPSPPPFKLHSVLVAIQYGNRRVKGKGWKKTAALLYYYLNDWLEENTGGADWPFSTICLFRSESFGFVSLIYSWPSPRKFSHFFYRSRSLCEKFSIEAVPLLPELQPIFFQSWKSQLCFRGIFIFFSKFTVLLAANPRG